jgi:hypothetical protein
MAGQTAQSTTKRLSRVLVRLAFFAGSIVAAMWAWTSTHDFIVVLYVSFVAVFGAAKSFGWPKPSWWGWNPLREVNNAWANRTFGRPFSATDTVNKLAECVPARQFLITSTYQENTVRMCSQYNDGLIMRITGFLFSGFFVAYLDHQGVKPPADETLALLRTLGLLSPIILALAWDVSRFERQRILNGEIHPPILTDDQPAEGRQSHNTPSVVSA